MSRYSRLHRLTVAGVAGLLGTMVVAGGVLAQGGDCHVTVEPPTVAVGGQFTVSGNFGPAEVHMVRGADNPPPEDSTPIATTTDSEGFSVTLTAEPGDEGVWTVWGLIPETECGDSGPLTVTPVVPDTAVTPPSGSAPTALGAIVIGLLVLGFLRLVISRQPA